MRYKDDWSRAKERLTAFWNGEIIDRCCISVKATDWSRMGDSFRRPEDEAGLVSYWTDPERIIRRNRLYMENTYYGGEAFPVMPLDLGAGGHAGFFKGARHQFAGTVWFFPSWKGLEHLEFDENSFLFSKTMELARSFAEDSKGDYMVSMPDCTGNADALAHLMGSEELLVEMLEDPETVHAALDQIGQSYERAMSGVFELVKDVNEGGGAIHWLNTWAPGFHAQMQCDMSVMISNPMFREFILPELKSQCRFLEYPLYHFDGIEQLRHLDDILSVPELRVIQWTQVDGQLLVTEYIPALQKIQAAGKNLLLNAVRPCQIRPLMENLSSKGLLLVAGAGSREEADSMIDEVAKLTHD